MAFRLNEEKRETENKTIRFSLPLINKIEKELSNTNITFLDSLFKLVNMHLKI